MPSRPRDGAPDGQAAVFSMPGHLMRRCHQIAVATFIADCEPWDLTPLQFGVLGAVEKPGPQDQASLGGLLALDRTTVAAVVRNLEGRGLVRRRPSPTDGRAKIVEITPEGSSLLAACLDAALASQDRIVAPLNAEERAQLVHLLGKIARENNALSRAPKREARKG